MNVQTPPQSLTFFVTGTPAPGGSKTVFPIWRRDGSLVTTIRNGRVWPVFNVTDDAGEGNKAWRKDVAFQAKQFMGGRQPFEGPLKVEFVFHLRRPRCHYRTGRFAACLKGDAPQHHTQMPDALKFARSTEDALTGIVWVDDSQTKRICSEKLWANPGDPIGCRITLIVL